MKRAQREKIWEVKGNNKRQTIGKEGEKFIRTRSLKRELIIYRYGGQVKRERGGYAFMMESASIQYIIERECDLGKYSTYCALGTLNIKLFVSNMCSIHI